MPSLQELKNSLAGKATFDRQSTAQRARQRVETHFGAERMTAATPPLYDDACGEISNLRSFA
jgi:hypothetical protein